MRTKQIIFAGMLLGVGSWVFGTSESPQEANRSFGRVAQEVQTQLEDGLAELTQLREQMAAEMLPLSRKLSDLESQLVQVRLQYQQTSRLLDSRTLDLSNLRSEIISRQEEAAYLSNLLGEYIRNFESRLHIAEIQRYRQPLEQAKLAAENSALSQEQVYRAQADLLSAALDRLEDALGGTRFDGTAVDASGLVRSGTFVLLGPAAIFRSQDGQAVGTVEQRLGSLEPTILPFGDPVNVQSAAQLITESTGLFPLDPTLGNARKIEQTRESLWEHVQKGGPVMIPIFALAGAALLVAILKWLGMALIRIPSPKRIAAFLKSVAEHDRNGALQKARALKGPIGQMLTAGAEHLGEPRDLIEEILFEKILAVRLKLERFLPFIAISAASAPLLGLLGTVTGIINTFKLITVFGSGDVKTLSGGISEALITTEFGLLVAIPSLLIHAFLSRKARRVINQMEKTAFALVNQIGKTPFPQETPGKQPSNPIPVSVSSPLVHPPQTPSAYSAGQSGEMSGIMMDSRIVAVPEHATVDEVIQKIRESESDSDLDGIFVVDEKNKYVGYVRVHHLLTRPPQARMESLAERKSYFVRIDTHRNEIQTLFQMHDLVTMPVLDHEDRLVGQVIRKRNGDRGGQ